MRDEGLRRQMGLAGRQIVEERFDLKRVVPLVVDLHRNVVG